MKEETSMLLLMTTLIIPTGNLLICRLTSISLHSQAGRVTTCMLATIANAPEDACVDTDILCYIAYRRASINVGFLS